MQQKLQKLKTNFLFFLELQLLISIVILPFLIAWGLPISIMTMVGNLVFAQFLTLFIFLSTLLFTTDLLGISNHIIVMSLESITNIWYYFLSFGSADWLIGFPSWTFPISCFFAMLACTLYYVKNYSQNYRILWLSLFCLATPIIHSLCTSKSIHTTLTQGSGKIHLIKIQNKVYAFDCGALGARPSSQSWIEYTLAPCIIKTMGATHIQTLFLCKSNSRTQQATEILTQSIPTSQIITIQNK